MSSLSPAQTHALFDILIHHQLYAEIESFKYASAIDHYGYPFRKDDGVQTTSPLLQNMLNKFVLRLPGLNNVGLEFWQEKCRLLVAKLGEAELSESYDKGAIGARKALATAISSLLEYIARGMLGGYPMKRPISKEKEYDTTKAEDILAAWDDGVQELIYGDLIDDLFRVTAETGYLEDHSSLVQGTHEYILLNLASFLHHTFIMSPDGQYILRLIENVHRLIPYYMVKQTLRVGNAATMINGMVKLVLTKISVTAVTNWIGLTNNINDGMNLMQSIISTVMVWDTSEFQKRAQKLESGRDAPCKSVLRAIKAHVYASREAHEVARSSSVHFSKSIIVTILESADPAVDTDSVTEHQHDIAMEYYSTLLSIRDREELTKILCKLQPDLLTSAIKDLINAYDPIIRAIHNAVDLSGTVTDAENFLTDLIKVSKPKRSNDANSRTHSRSNSRSNSPIPNGKIVDVEPDHGGLPTVEDYVLLLRKHIPSAHKFMHQVAKNAPDLANQYREYVIAVIAEFRVRDATSNLQPNGETETGAGSMTAPLISLFSTLEPSKQEELRKLLDLHEKHLSQLKSTSSSRLKSIIPSRPPSSSFSTSKSTHAHAGTTHGPGMYLSRWHALIDSTLISPASKNGPVRRGWEVKGELDGKGSKTDTHLPRIGHGKRGGSGNLSIGDGIGDALERKERKRDGKEEIKTERVWEVMRGVWEELCRGMEVMGPS
ncbi:hypothetical protein K469DRAFT_641714 [Zopfia rhizophila CBS 207.26]|uniref:Uncharacterized protein n=1 Tax=Zopfia rhizophila CBS 207.26 TaxID=1314779 RepID=A0A6A6DN52_9PEZI|nr:hypothetical protein K469DRAFT_641714 [Zopfia rhizophila CBS 207.26]